MTDDISQSFRSELAPTGKLRAALNHGNFLLVTPNTKADPCGIAPDIAGELARRLRLPLEFVNFDTAGGLADAAPTGVWDVAFLGAEPQRAGEIAFTAAYLEIPSTYLVPDGSPIHSISDVDSPGVRIAVAEQSAYALYLERSIKHAQLVMAKGLDGSLNLFLSGKLDVLAGLKPRLLSDVEKLSGARLLDGHFYAVPQAIGTPKARTEAAKFLRAFVEDVKSSGFVANAIEKNGAKGVSVVPPAQ
jgi:polar amino acid transport system substrate-binding protein